MKSSRFFALLVFVSIGFTASFEARATIVSERIAATRRLQPLTKVTVGPDDQYHGSIDAKGEMLVYTHKADLVSHLRLQDLKSGDVRDFLPLTGDSQEPVFGPTGLVAFTYYKLNARGDICYAQPPKPDVQLRDSDIHCLPRSNKNEARSNPFWRSENEIGYVTENPIVADRQVVVQNTETGHRDVLVSGKVFSPSMKPGGHLLVYSSIVPTPDSKIVQRVLLLRNLATQESHEIVFDLPGFSGFPALSGDESMLYFSQYLNDSNNDNTIDGNDNAVLFRIPVSEILKAKPGDKLFPEQLTSLESSCSFPKPHGDQIFATCAFEGHLDIYRLPITGIVPTNWNRSILDNALQTSRSYQERILILNAEKYRFHTPIKNESDKINHRLLVNHILSDEVAAARTYLNQVASRAATSDKEFYSLIDIYLSARQLKKQQPSDDIGRVFRSQVLEIDHRVAKMHPSSMATILRGILRVELAEFAEAQNFLNQVRFEPHVRPLERYLYFILAEQTEKKFLPKSEAKLLDFYKTMMTAPELDEEAHIYYAFKMLSQTEEIHPDRAARIKVIEKIATGFKEPVKLVLDADSASLELLQAPDDLSKGKVYARLDHLMSVSRSDYFLRKAIYVRAILDFAKAAEFRFLDLIATGWLKYTEQTDTEFIYAREVVSISAMDQAYANFAARKNQLADNFFYEALSLTDDLEAHYGYIATMVRENQRKTIDVRYRNLQNRHFIDDNMKFVDALLILIDQAPALDKDSALISPFEHAVEKLSAMDQDRDSPSRYLLLGYCYLQELQRTAKGLEFSADLMQKANRNLMLAYDLGRDNARIRASALMNLGILQERVQNHELAVKFFALRKEQGFSTLQEKSDFEWLYARSLFLSNQSAAAAKEISETGGSNPEALERSAFYLLAANHFDEAVQAYQNFFSAKPALSEMSLAKAEMSYGYALLKSHTETEAKSRFKEAIQHLDHLPTLKREGDRVVDFIPKRLEAIAYGFLAQMGTSNERKDALEKRIGLLESDATLFDDVSSLIIEAHLQIAGLAIDSDTNLAKQHITLAVQTSAKSGSACTSHAVYAAAEAGLMLNVLKPSTVSADESKMFLGLARHCQQEFEIQKIPQTYLIYQDLKLALLKASIEKDSSAAGTLLTSNQAQKVKTELPGEWQSLVSLANGLKTHF